jgi:hypothetical protein
MIYLRIPEKLPEMKKSSCLNNILIISMLLISIFFFGCKKKYVNPILFEKGTFPDTVLNMADLNSQYDDYNTDIHQLMGGTSIVFSSNRSSSGGQFDIVQGGLSFMFDQTDGFFQIVSAMSNDGFLTNLLQKANTSGNDFGPYRFFSATDGYDYMVVSSVNSITGKLDLYYLRNRPQYGLNYPDIEGPTPVSLLNTASDDAYFCFDQEQDSAYFTSNRGGNFDIYLQGRAVATPVATWFNQGFATSSKVDSLNSTADDKCPLVFRKIMVFASNRPGGLGGYDLYYSLFKKGKWSSPVNFGPGINTSYDEFRPILGAHDDFTNYFMMFSSNRPEGKGGFDLYFSGVSFK